MTLLTGREYIYLSSANQGMKKIEGVLRGTDGV